MSNSEPLWKVMRDAYWRLVDTSTPYSPPENEQWRDAITAIADEIAAHPMADRCTEWGDVADWLRSEADRAEDPNG